MTLSVISWDSRLCMWGVESVSSLELLNQFLHIRDKEGRFFCVLLELGSPCLYHWCLFVSPNTDSELVYDYGALWCTSFYTHGLCTLDFIWIWKWLCVVWVIINYLSLSMASSLLYWVPLSIMVHLPGWNRTSSLKKYLSLTRVASIGWVISVTLPITLSIHPSLENDHSCLAFLPSNSTPSAPLSQHQSSQV